MISGNYQLLKVKEQISENLSSVQIAQTLDDLIMNCIKPLVKNTKFLEYTFVELLPHIFLNQRRKFSIKPMGTFCDDIFTFITINNYDDKIKILQKMGLERSVYLTVLSQVEKVAIEYLDIINENLVALQKNPQHQIPDLNYIYKNFYVKDDFYHTAHSIMYWLNYVYKFRGMIVEKYIRHAQNESKKMANSTDLNIDKEDLFRDLIISVYKAIDKYNPQMGPLTSYVNQWFMEAKTNVKNRHEYGVAFQIPTNQRKKMVDQGSLQSITLELNDEIAESIEDITQNTLQNIIGNESDYIINNLVCRVDTYKVYCLTNNITYTLTPQDKEIQKQSRLPVTNMEY